MNKLSIVTVAVLLSSTTCANAGPIAYAVSSTDALYRLDLGTARATLIGVSSNNVTLYEGLALSPIGELFATDALGQLHSVDTSTGLATLIDDTGRGNIEGLDFFGDTLVGVDFLPTPTLFSIDTSNASTSDIVTASVATGEVRSMTRLDADTALIRTDDPVFETLRSIDLNTGLVTDIGVLLYQGFANEKRAGLDFASDGTLYALSDGGDVYTVNLNDASATLIGRIPSSDLFSPTEALLGLAVLPDAVQPVPEPSSVVLLGMGVTGLFGYGWRRKRKTELSA